MINSLQNCIKRRVRFEIACNTALQRSRKSALAQYLPEKVWLVLWNLVLLQGLQGVPIEQLEKRELELLFEYSLEYDLESARYAYRTEQAKKAKNAPPENEVMKALGYTEEELL